MNLSKQVCSLTLILYHLHAELQTDDLCSKNNIYFFLAAVRPCDYAYVSVSRQLQSNSTAHLCFGNVDDTRRRYMLTDRGPSLAAGLGDVTWL